MGILNSLKQLFGSDTKATAAPVADMSVKDMSMDDCLCAHDDPHCCRNGGEGYGHDHDHHHHASMPAPETPTEVTQAE